MICVKGACLGSETRNQKPCHTELPALSLTKGSRSAETRNITICPIRSRISLK
jgi:hypothetical protein